MTPSVHAARRRAVETTSAALQRVPAGPWTAVARRAPGALGAAAGFSATRATLADGTVPEDLADAVARLLDRADAARTRGHVERAAEWFDGALQLAFHPTVHHGYAPSPLLSDPDAFLRPFRESAMGRLMLEAPDPERAERPGGRRVLAVAHSAWTFLDRLIEATEGEEGLHWERLDLASVAASERPSHRRAVRARARFALTGERPAVPEWLVRRLDGVDTLFVEWGAYPLACLSLMDLGATRLVCRLHRYEAMSPYPLLTDFANVDEMLFISPSVRASVAAAAPRLAQAHRVATVRNPHDYTRFTTEKEPGAERTLAQIGWATPVKDVLFTLDVLERLREEDPSWRLLLIGPLPAHRERRDEDYARRAEERLARLGDAVEVLGRRDDVPQVLHRVGFLISSSRHEGTHESVAEGAAAGCVPIVRAWPDAEPWAGGARSIYPEDWVVGEREGAVAAIRALADPGKRSRAGLAAAAWVAENLRPEAVPRPYVDAVLGHRA